MDEKLSLKEKCENLRNETDYCVDNKSKKGNNDDTENN